MSKIGRTVSPGGGSRHDLPGEVGRVVGVWLLHDAPRGPAATEAPEDEQRVWVEDLARRVSLYRRLLETL